MGLLRDVHVVDFTGNIAGPYCTKLLADAGAEVVKVEPAGGDPLRGWTASGQDLGGRDGALFQYLNASKQSLVGDCRSPQVQERLRRADLVLVDDDLDTTDLDYLIDQFPSSSVVSITPFGRTGPWADRPASEFILQALCGSIAGRGTADREPFHAGGRLGEWIAGTFAALTGLAALHGARRRGRGEFVDVSMLESMCIFMGGSAALGASLGMRAPADPPRTVEIPSIEPTADDYIGFCTVTAQQFQDFLVLIERPDLLEDEDLASMVGRQSRRAEFLEVVRSWTRKRPTALIEDQAAAMRIPVSPIGRPETLTSFEQFRERGVFVDSPSGQFLQPRPPYRVDNKDAEPFRPAPALGEHDQSSEVPTDERPGAIVGSSHAGRPLEGVRIVDLTAFWAGPSATLTLAALGAEVIKIESIQRPDGMRFSSAKGPGTDHWWEWGSVYQGNNLNKLDVTLDLTSSEGLDLLLRLIAKSDAIIENFSPRVADNFGLSWERVKEANPRIVFVRMPAFGLSGPWRDRTGFAQTMEQASGMAWMTGFRDGPPIIPRGPCDPLAGMHAAFGLLASLRERETSGSGHFVESTMVEAALNVAAEVQIEHSAYGASLQRDGNRGPVAAPQGLYRCAGEESWLALAVVTDLQWVGLRRALGDPEWAEDPELATAKGRRLRHDSIDDQLGVFFANTKLDEIVDSLLEEGVPAAPAVHPLRVVDNPQMRYRGFIESFDHPVVGTHEVLGMPFRFASHDGSWYSSASPTLGQHNREVLQGLLALSDADYDRLCNSRVIGDRPLGA